MPSPMQILPKAKLNHFKALDGRSYFESIPMLVEWFFPSFGGEIKQM